MGVGRRDRRGRPRHRLGTDDVAQALVVALGVIVVDELSEYATQVPLAEGDDVAQTLLLDRANKSFRVGVQVRAACRQAYHVHAGRLEKATELDALLTNADTVRSKLAVYARAAVKRGTDARWRALNEPSSSTKSGGRPDDRARNSESRRRAAFVCRHGHLPA